MGRSGGRCRQIHGGGKRGNCSECWKSLKWNRHRRQVSLDTIEGSAATLLSATCIVEKRPSMGAKAVVSGPTDL